MNTRDMIREFSLAFERPVNDDLVIPSVSDRILLGKLLLEEAVETITKGLGLNIYGPDGIIADAHSDLLTIEHLEGRLYDPIETFDGLGDTNVVIHFIAHWLGGDLDRVTEAIHASNMSKLDENGEPIINECKYFGGDKMPTLMTGVEAIPETTMQCSNRMRFNKCDDPNHRIDPSKPIGKILKGPNFREPDIASAIGLGPIAHIDESTIQPEAALDHCSEHPDQTTENCSGGYGLAGGGVGMYYICDICGGIFGKTNDGDDFG